MKLLEAGGNRALTIRRIAVLEEWCDSSKVCLVNITKVEDECDFVDSASIDGFRPSMWCFKFV